MDFTTKTTESRLIKNGRLVEVPKPIETIKNIKKYPESELSIESNQIQTKVLDSNHNLVAIGYVMCENNDWLFKPTKVFI